MEGPAEFRMSELEITHAPVQASVWHAKVGQDVLEGDRLLEVVAGDVTIDLPSPVSGVLLEKHVERDDPLATGQLLGVLKNIPLED